MSIIEKLFEDIPNGWTIARLSSYLKNEKNAIKAGPFGSHLTNLDMQGSDIKVYNQRTVLDKDFTNGEYYISAEKFAELKGFIVEPNDLLVTTRGSIGKCVIVPTDVELGILHPCLIKMKINEVKIIPQFLQYIFNDTNIVKEQVQFLSNSTTIDVIYTQTLKDLKFTIPTKSVDQKTIVAYLNKKISDIDSLIYMKEAKLNLLEQQRQSIITEAVTKGLNPNVKMKDSGVEWIGEIPENWTLNKIKYCTDLLGEKSEEHSELQYVGLENIESKTGKYISSENVEIDGAAIKFFQGNVLFGKLRPYLTKALLAEFDGRCSTEILVLKPISSLINNVYLKSLLLTPKFIDEVNSSTYGSKMPRANWSFIGNTLIPVPPLNEQEAIVKEIINVEANNAILTSKLNEQIEKLKEYRQALIYEAVTGKMDVREMEID